MKNTIRIFLSSALLILALGSCAKKDQPTLGDYPKDDQVLPGGDLRVFLPFGGTESQARFNVKDSISGNPALSNPLTLVDGINGKAVQGADEKAIKYMTANDMKLAKSFTLALWMKKAAETGRTEFVFSLADTKYSSGHSSALFLMVEHQTATQATMKLGLMDQWLEGTFVKPLFDGQWHHMAFVYDQATSKMAYYFDGAAVSGMNAAQTDVKKAGSPRGPVDFSSVTNLVIGGWNKHASIAGTTDDWAKSFKGAIDQFRMYNKVLTAAEVAALFTNKQ